MSAIITNSYFAKLHQRAAELGWRCLSQEWAGTRVPYTFECASGHRFERAAKHVLYNPSTHCIGCEADIIRAQWLASVAERGGTLLGVFAGLTERHRSRCANGHEWEATGSAIRKGHWCLKCHRQERSLANGLVRLQAAAAAKGGDVFLRPIRAAVRATVLSVRTDIVGKLWVPRRRVERGVCAARMRKQASERHRFFRSRRIESSPGSGTKAQWKMLDERIYRIGHPISLPLRGRSRMGASGKLYFAGPMVSPLRPHRAAHTHGGVAGDRR